MSILSRASFLAAALLFAFDAQANAQTVPDDTAAFISYCNDANFQVCRRKVVDVNNIMLMRQIGGNHGCTFPRPSRDTRADSVPATKAILDWLRNNTASPPLKTDLAIVQAIERLWPENCEH